MCRRVVPKARAATSVRWSCRFSEKRTTVSLKKPFVLQNHRFTFNEAMLVESVTQSLCDVALRFSEEGDGDDEEDALVRIRGSSTLLFAPLILSPHLQSRPFGVALLLAGIAQDGPALYHMDPSGTYVRFEAKAIGSASEGAQSALQDEYNKVPLTPKPANSLC